MSTVYQFTQIPCRSVTICQNTSTNVLCIIWTSKRKNERDGQHCNMFYCVQANAWLYLVSVIVHTTSSLLENVLSNGLSLCHSPLLQQHIIIVASPPSTTNNTRCLCMLCVFLLALKACSAPQHFHIAYRNVNELNELICLRNAANGYETTEQIFIPTVENVFGLVSPMSTSGLWTQCAWNSRKNSEKYQVYTYISSVIYTHTDSSVFL